ncbi:MAG: hypothetical protein ACYSUB_13660 [Planctomycetota bacterium]|jgi:hypothetical protein
MNKIITFLEEHIEKIILVIVGLVCVWLLITRVLFSPNMVSYRDGKFSPGAIDDYVYEQAELLRQRLNDPPEPLEPYEPRLAEFLAKVDSAISDIDISLWPPRPYASSMSAGVEIAGKYLLPRIPEVNDVTAEHIRAAAYVPTQEITEQILYDKATHEANDIDFITVEGKFDTAKLYDRFYESFAGEDVPDRLRDPCLARPIFAAAHLQRQELNGDGSWSDWQDVPRTRIDHHRKLFQIIEEVEDLPPGGLKVRILRFDDWQVQTDLLQPQTYQIASPKEEWFPPSLHQKFVVLRESEEREEKRVTREKQQEEERRDSTQYRRRRVPDARTRGASAGEGYEGLGGMEGLYGDAETRTTRRRGRSGRSTEGGVYGEGGGLGTGGRSSRQRTRSRGVDSDIERQLAARRRERARKPTTNDVYYEFNKIQINYGTDLAKMREPLLFWAHDDTVEPKKSYRYKIRLGVFNPAAEAKKNNVILWSESSGTTETITIPGMQYFFAKDVQEAAKTVTVTVCKYVLGYWYSEDFAVRQGEVIGKVVESEPKEDEPFARGPYGAGGAYGGGLYGAGQYGPLGGSVVAANQFTEPEIINYTTGAVLVDIIAVNDWLSGRNMRARHYFDMLYSFDGNGIEHMPINRRYWAAELQTAFGEIRTLLNEPKEPLRAWGSKRAGLKRGPDLEYGEYDEGYEDEMYEDEMMMGGGRYR